MTIIHPIAAIPLAASAAPPANSVDMRKAAEAFEAIIVRQMLAAMRQAKLGDELFGSGASDSFRELADARTADSIASQRQFGIAAMVEGQFRKPDRDMP